MTFGNDFTRKYLDASEVDAIRALRPTGPLDTFTVALKCTRCSQEKSEAVRWFHLHDFICPCGGAFDDKPLRDAIAKLTVDYLMKTHTPEEVLEILKDREGKTRSG